MKGYIKFEFDFVAYKEMVKMLKIYEFMWFNYAYRNANFYSNGLFSQLHILRSFN